MNPETLQAMKEAAEKAQGHRWVESALAVAYIVDIDNAHAVVASVVEYNVDGTIHLEFENAVNHQRFIAVCNPANLLALIAERDELAAEVERQAGEIAELKRKNISLRNAWKDTGDDTRSAAVEARWQVAQGEDYGSY